MIGSSRSGQQVGLSIIHFHLNVQSGELVAGCGPFLGAYLGLQAGYECSRSFCLALLCLPEL